ncbi:MAG: TonB C-terminal domain-containing protein [Gemmatimonadales bacterium]|nr:TonB C-terminal domain-containing protein [Gemmatimonadales bacterium]
MPRGAVWSGLAWTLLVHVAGVGALFFSVKVGSKYSPPTYAVTLVAAPPATATARAPTTEPPAPAPAPAPPKVQPKAKAPPAKPTAKAPAKAAGRRDANPSGPLPGEKPGQGSDIANVNLQGKEFPYPEYLRNIVTQIYRRWNRPANNAPLEAEVSFVILRDGTVRDIKILRGSKSYSFDDEALGAVETAANAKAFGALPAGYPSDYLPISFLFTPRQLP